MPAIGHYCLIGVTVSQERCLIWGCHSRQKNLISKTPFWNQGAKKICCHRYRACHWVILNNQLYGISGVVSYLKMPQLPEQSTSFKLNFWHQGAMKICCNRCHACRWVVLNNQSYGISGVVSYLRMPQLPEESTSFKCNFWNQGAIKICCHRCHACHLALLFTWFYDISGVVSYLRMPQLPEESPSFKHIFWNQGTMKICCHRCHACHWALLFTWFYDIWGVVSYLRMPQLPENFQSFKCLQII